MTLLAEDAGARVAAIIVAYNSAGELPTLLESLDASTVGVHAIVVDNGSQDASVDVARGYAAVTVIPTGANLGYSGGINIGRARVRDDQMVAILNPDLVVAPDALARLIDVVAQGGAGVAGPKITDPDGSIYLSLHREPSLLGALGDALVGDSLIGRPSRLSEQVFSPAEYSRRHAVDWLSGAALLLSARCNRAVGEWDAARYFLYSEETDVQRRARDAGFAVVFEPSATVTHVGGASGASSELDALLAVNRIRYVEKFHSRAYAFAYRALVLLHYGLRALLQRRYATAAKTVASRSRWERLPQYPDVIPHAETLGLRSVGGGA